MKSNLAATILILACLGLGVVLWNQTQKHADQTKDLHRIIDNLDTNLTSLKTELARQNFSNEMIRVDLTRSQLKASNELAAERIRLADASNSLEQWQAYAMSHSNTVVTLQEQLARQALINSTLLTNLDATKHQAANDLAAAQTSLAAIQSKAANELAEAKAATAAAASAAAAATAAAAEKDRKIAELESQNSELEKQSHVLQASITNLEAQAKAIQKKLDTSEGDNKLLIAEWKAIEAQKEDYQKKFNDVVALKAQVRTLQDNITTARRLDWIERGLYEAIGKKEGQVLLTPLPPGAPTPTNVSLEVEVHDTGSVRINSPAPTNAPSTNRPTARGPSGL